MCTLYDRIKSLCKEKGVSASRMCLDLGLSKSTMSDMKSGRKKGVSAETALKIAEYFGMTVDELYGREPLINEENPGTIAGTEVDEVTMELMDIIQNGTDEDRQDLLEMYRMLKRRAKR